MEVSEVVEEVVGVEEDEEDEDGVVLLMLLQFELQEKEKFILQNASAK